ncbi:hypothetical protein AAULR_07064 [Lacticaseibacillus rhamnosus MTCC 5462]|nr:hypothetical protein AAULR_07064 [Lacticaseibacillus rhamnosus MTCC 5462]
MVKPITLDEQLCFAIYKAQNNITILRAGIGTV